MSRRLDAHLVATPRPHVEEAKIDGRVLRRGDLVKIKGLPGILRVEYFEPDLSAVTVVAPGVGFRTVDLKRLSTRKALAGSERAAELTRRSTEIKADDRGR